MAKFGKYTELKAFLEETEIPEYRKVWQWVDRFFFIWDNVNFSFLADNHLLKFLGIPGNEISENWSRLNERG